MWLRSWARVVRNVTIDVDRNHTMAFAAGLSYYFFLSFFPALIAISALISLFLPLHSLYNPLLDALSRVVPADSMGVVRQVSSDLLAPNRGVMLLVGLIGTLWAASNGFDSMIEALDVAYDVTKRRPYWTNRAVALLMTFVVGGLLLVALGLVLLGPQIGDWLAHTHWPLLASIWPAVCWTLAGACIVAAVEGTYLLGPNVKQRVAHTLIGASFAVAVWLALSYGLNIYFYRFANLNRTYGTLGGVIAIMIWLYWSFFAILLGAEINGETIKALQSGQRSTEKITHKPAADGDIAA